MAKRKTKKGKNKVILAKELKELVETYCKETGVKPTGFLQRACGNSHAWEGIKCEDGRITLRNINRILNHASIKWPQFCDWPDNLPRP